MPEFTLILANKTYSSWSLRGWLALMQTGAPFTEEMVPLDLPDSRAALLARSPSGLVPVLRVAGDPELQVHDSLAITEYLAERFPDQGLWPNDQRQRAMARSVTCEMHAGFAALRRFMPMDLRMRDPDLGARLRHVNGVDRDIERVVAIWEQCLAARPAGGPFLFGPFCAADCAFAPVVTRFWSHGVELPPAATAYRDAVRNHPHMQEWTAAATAETWRIDYPERDQAAAR